MRLYIIFPLFCFSFVPAFGQDKNPDSIRMQTEQQRLVVKQSNQKVDLIQAAFYQKSDSLKNLYKSKFSKLDSSQSALKSKLDKLASRQFPSKHLSTGNKIDSVQSTVKGRMDSLTARLHTNKIIVALDSINQLRDSALTSLNQKLQSVKDKSIGKLNSLNLPPEVKDKASTVTGAIRDFKIPAAGLNISAINLEGNMSLPTLGNLNVPSPSGGMGTVGGVEGMRDVKGEMGGIKDITGKVSGYGNDVKQLASGDISQAAELSKTAETKAEELSGLNEVKDQTQVLDKYKDMGEKIQNPDSLKEFAVQEVRQLAVNHFAGKEQQLKEAMETVAKYKTKYSSLNNISEITKKPPNEMKGKPLIERIVPGIGLQVQKKGDDLMVDFNAYAGYRFTGRITGGLGWNQRVAYSLDKNKFNPDARIFGPRAFGEFKLWKGFSPRAELETMNTNVLPTSTPAFDAGEREWVWGAFVGLKKEYRFIKSVKGTALVMIRLFNSEHKSPYADVVNVRFGFEFPIKKKVKS